MELKVGAPGALVSVNTMFVLTGPGLFPVSRARTWMVLFAPGVRPVMPVLVLRPTLVQSPLLLTLYS